MSKHKKQHFIPQCYLKAWLDPSALKDPDPYVWVFSIDGNDVKKKAPRNVFFETDMYTITNADGDRNLVLERGLGQAEGDFASIRDRKISHQRPLDPMEHMRICVFIAAMQGRTRANRDHLRQQWNQPLELMDKMIEWAQTATPEQVKQALSASVATSSTRDSLSYEDVKQFVQRPLQNMLPSIVRVASPLLCRLDFAVLTTTDEIGFITSDHPVIWFDAEAYKRPPLWRAPALMYESIEITLPVSPQQCILLNRRGVTGYIPVPQSVVDENNRRVRFSAQEYFVVCRKEKRDIWFDPGEEPRDSWEKTHP
ncbi:MAG: DUF4238 domain-containing protein [Armatimonadetes bacterium]|nr:DUF4238 domain-containing protein [Armatimonadota bacterium]